MWASIFSAMSRRGAPSLQRETPTARAPAATLPASRSFCRTASSIVQVLAAYHALSDDLYRIPAQIDNRGLVLVARRSAVDVEIHGIPELGTGVLACRRGLPAVKVRAGRCDGSERICDRDGDRVVGNSDADDDCAGGEGSWSCGGVGQ